MPSSLAAAVELRDHLLGLDVMATLDVRDVLGNVPCVLIPPPRWVDWNAVGDPVFEWRLIAISGQGLGNLDAWAELDALVSDLAVALPIGTADPISYRLPTGGPDLPAYAVTYSGS